MSSWEWRKNKALLELEQRNQKLQSLLDKALASNNGSRISREVVAESLAANEHLEWKMRKLQESLVRQTLVLSQNRRLIAVICVWRALSADSRKQKAVDKAEGYWNKQLLKRAFGGFITIRQISLSRGQLLTQARQQRTRVILSCCLRLWTSIVKYDNQARDTLWKYKRVLRSRVLRSCFIAWQSYSDNAKEKDLTKKSIENHLLMNNFRKAWQLWKSSKASEQLHITKAESHFARGVQQRIIGFWRHVILQKEEREKKVTLNVHWNNTRLLQRALASWKARIKYENLLDRRSAMVIQQKQWGLLLSSFLEWYNSVRSRKEIFIREKLLRMKREMRLKTEALIVLKNRRNSLKMTSRVRAWRAANTRMAVMHAWSKVTQERISCMQQVQRIRKRTKFRFLQKTFSSWLIYVEICRRSSLVNETETLATRLEVLKSDLAGAGNMQEELEKLVKTLRVEKMTVIDNMGAIMARTPIWTSGFLDADLRWTFPPVSSSCLPSARAGHSAVLLQPLPDADAPTYIVVYGGYNGHEVFNDVIVLDTGEMTWKVPGATARENSIVPRPTRNHSACAYGNNQIIIFGGFDGTQDCAELYVMTLSDDGSSCEWTQPERVVGITPSPISQHACCMHYDKQHMIVFGGYRACDGHLNELWILDLRWMEWHSPDYYGTPPSSRRGHGAVVIGTKMYVFGGYDGTKNLSDLHTLDLDTMEWQLVQTQGQSPTPRRQHSVALVGKYFVIFGGHDGVDYFDDVYSLDTDTNIWKHWPVMKSNRSRTENPEIYGRSLHSMVFLQHQLFIIGGVHAHGPLQDILCLENGAVAGGLQLQEQYISETKKVHSLQKKVLQCGQILKSKNADLVRVYTKLAHVQDVLKVEAKGRKMAMQRQRVLLQKLKRLRSKGNRIH